MLKSVNSIIGVLVLCCCALAQTESTKSELGFAKERFESGLNAAFEKKDAKAVGQYLASIYNEGGVSREMAIRQLDQLFQRSDVRVHYHVVDFHRFPRTKIGYVRTLTEMSVSGPNVAARTLRTAGYISVINENGSWRAFASQPAGGCPGVVGFDYAAETGNWSGWGSQLNPAALAAGGLSRDILPQFSAVLVSPGAPNTTRPITAHSFRVPADPPRFDKEAWEKRYQHAWNTRNKKEIVGFYAQIYNEFGINKTGVLAALTKTLQNYTEIELKYRVLGFSQLPGTDLASLKAVMDLRGIRQGSTELTPILQVMGYASLIPEGKEWKVYATQLFTTPEIEKANFEEMKTKEWPPRLNLTVKR